MKVTQLKRIFGYFFSTLLLVNILFVSVYVSKQVSFKKHALTEQSIDSNDSFSQFELRAAVEKNGTETEEIFIGDIQPLLFSVGTFFQFFKIQYDKNDLILSYLENKLNSKLPFYLIYEDFRL